MPPTVTGPACKRRGHQRRATSRRSRGWWTNAFPVSRGHWFGIESEKLKPNYSFAMDQQTLLNIFFGLFSAAAGWFAREMWAAVKELKSDLAKLREELPAKYVPKDDFKDGVREIKDMLSRLFDKLDHKVDKP